MSITNGYRLRAEWSERLRRFEWELARDEQVRQVRLAIRKRTHELLNFVQVVDLASQAIRPHCQPAADEFLVDLANAAQDAKGPLRELQALGHAEDRPPARTAVAAVARAAIDHVRPAVDSLDAQVLVDDGIAIPWTREELELVLAAVALDGLRDAHVELLVRARELDGRASVEIVCGPVDDGGLAFRLASAVAGRTGGDAAVAERRGGGFELAVTVPCLA